MNQLKTIGWIAYHSIAYLGWAVIGGFCILMLNNHNFDSK